MSHQINAGDRRAVSSGPRADREIWPIHTEVVSNVWPSEEMGPVSREEGLRGELLALMLNNLSPCSGVSLSLSLSAPL